MWRPDFTLACYNFFMSPTIFSASDVQQKSRQRELEEELKKITQANKNNGEDLSQSAERTAEHPTGESTNVSAKQSTLDSEEKPIRNPYLEESRQEEPTLDDNPFTDTTEVLAEVTPNKLGSSVASASKTEDSQSAPSPEEPSVEPIKSNEPEDYSDVMRNEKPTTNPLASFVVRPPGVSFVNQHSKEKILLVLRQHPIVNFKWVVISVFLILAPFLVFPLLPLFDFLASEFKFFTMVGWYLLVSAYVIEHLLYWYYNIYLITDERIIDIDFISLIYRRVSEAKIDKIEDVTSATTGLFAGIFNYGNVTIQTAAEKREFEFLAVPQPEKVTRLLNELVLEEEREKNEGRVM